MWIKDYIKDQLRYQVQDLSSVKINHKYSERLNKFFIDSRAGLLVYKPTGPKDVARFRDKWINQIETMRVQEQNGKLDPFDIYVIYEDIIQAEKVSYEANMNTRLKKSWNCLKSKLIIF